MTSKGCTRGWPLEHYAQLELRAPAGPDRGQRPYPGPGGAGEDKFLALAVFWHFVAGPGPALRGLADLLLPPPIR